MRRVSLRLGQWLLIAALLSASGAQWIALQSVAWGTMLADYARSSSWSSAVHKTFDGRHPCALCQRIEQGKKSDKKTDVTVLITKMNFLHESRAGMIMRTGGSWELAAADSWSEPRFERPPLPPPRGLAG